MTTIHSLHGTVGMGPKTRFGSSTPPPPVAGGTSIPPIKAYLNQKFDANSARTAAMYIDYLSATAQLDGTQDALRTELTEALKAPESGIAIPEVQQILAKAIADPGSTPPDERHEVMEAAARLMPLIKNTNLLAAYLILLMSDVPPYQSAPAGKGLFKKAPVTYSDKVNLLRLAAGAVHYLDLDKPNFRDKVIQEAVRSRFIRPQFKNLSPVISDAGA